MKKILIRLFVVLFVLGAIFLNEIQFVNAEESNLGSAFNPNLLPQNRDAEIEGKIEDIAIQIAKIIRIFTVAGVAIVGLKYMLSDSQGRSKIKDNLIWMLVGVLLVTSATVIIQKVAQASKEAIPM